MVKSKPQCAAVRSGSQELEYVSLAEITSVNIKYC